MIEITISDNRIKKIIDRIGNKIYDMTPAMRKIAGIMHDAVEENFERQGRPRWKKLAPSTIRQREREGKWPGKILQKSAGGLASSISSKYDSYSARVGTNKVYAAIHQFGGEAGKGLKVTIPARPYLKLTAKDTGKIKMALTDYLFKKT